MVTDHDVTAQVQHLVRLLTLYADNYDALVAIPDLASAAGQQLLAETRQLAQDIGPAAQRLRLLLCAAGPSRPAGESPAGLGAANTVSRGARGGP